MQDFTIVSETFQKKNGVMVFVPVQQLAVAGLRLIMHFFLWGIRI